MGSNTKGRAATAIGLLLGFYALAAMVIAALVGFNVVLWNEGRVNGRLALITLIIAFVLIRAVFFIRSDFAPPDNTIALRAAEQPALFEEIRTIADRMNTSMPDVVMLAPDVNAYVVEDTALLGLVSKQRYLAIGVGLMHALTVDQLRAVIAHEFGHYAGSDTRLGAIAYRGRESITRAVQGMGGGVLGVLFQAYAKFYWRVTASGSRAQELAADRWAAEIGGTEAAAEALERVAQASMAWDLMINAYVVPLAQQGHRPANVFAGYRELLANPERSEQIGTMLSEHPPSPGAYDTHPPTSDRVAAIRALPAVAHVDDDRVATELLADRETAERTVTAEMFTESANLAPIDWSDAGAHLRVPFAEAGAQIMQLVAGDAAGSEQFLARIREGDLERVRQDLAATFDVSDGDPRQALRPFVRTALVHLAGDDRSWQVNWSGPIQAADLDIEALTDALLEGGEAAEAAHAELAGGWRD